MVLLDSTELQGFTIEDYHRDRRVYSLPGSEVLSIGKGGTRAEIIFATASNHHPDDHPPFFAALEAIRSTGLEPIVCADAEFNNDTVGPAERALVDQLRMVGVTPTLAFPSFFDGVFDDPEYIQVTAQCSSPRALIAFLRKGLSVVAQCAVQRVAGDAHPYHIAVPELLADIGEYIGRPLRIKGVHEVIAGYTTDQTVRNLHVLTKHPYVHAIVQPNGSSFTYDREMVALVQQLAGGLSDDLEKSRAVFDWVIANIPYGDKHKLFGVGYRGALEVFRNREGICGESAALQATLERLAGNTAFLASIEKGTPGVSSAGRSFVVGGQHSCVAHLRPSGEILLIDTTARDGFGIRYERFKIQSDDLSLARYW